MSIVSGTCILGESRLAPVMVTLSGNPEIHELVPEPHLVDHVLKDVAAVVIPEKAPVHVALRIKRIRMRLAQESLPVHMLRVAVGWDFARPSAVGSVAVVMGMEGRDVAQLPGSDHLPNGAEALEC